MPGCANMGRPTGLVLLVWASVDHHRGLTHLAVGGLLAGAILAVTGPPPLDLHGPLHYLGIMDPGCGMTRGVLWTLRGRLDRAWAYNPASPLLVAGALAGCSAHEGWWTEEGHGGLRSVSVGGGRRRGAAQGCGLAGVGAGG